MAQTNYLSKDYEIFIGLDVDKNSFSFTVKDNYIMNQSKKIVSNPEHFYNYVQNNFQDKKVLCAYESGPTGFHLYDYLQERKIPCLVVSPSSIPTRPNERVKTNRLDSERIAQSLKSGELKSIRVPEGSYRELRYLVKTREDYAFNQKVTKQRIKALLLSCDLYSLIKEPEIRWSNYFIRQLKQISCSPAIRVRLNMLINDINYNRKQILSILQELRNFCKINEELNQNILYLRSIPGIGFITAVTALSNIGDPKNLENVRELGSFTGLIPREHSTGDNINRGAITHLGNQTFRSLLIEAAWVAIRKDNELNQFYNRIKSRHHPKAAARKAIVAVARKLTQRIYKVLKEQRIYIIH